jgi:uncharacterized repeat protein (TIGR01451 family)
MIRLGAGLCGCFVAVCLLLVSAAPSALAVSEPPQWTVTAVSAPTNFAPGDESGDDSYKVIVKNTGGSPTVGQITVSDTLPEGLTLDRRGVEGFVLSGRIPRQELVKRLSCEGLTCVYEGVVVPDETLLVTIPVDVGALALPSCKVPAAPVVCVANLVRVSGGGAPDAEMETPTAISSDSAQFGIAPGSVTTALSSTQAGAHADLTTSIGFDTLDNRGTLAGNPKETVVELPPGFGGDLVDTPTCSAALFLREECPIGTQIGITTATLDGGAQVYTDPVYNLAPEPGDVAKLGFPVVGFDVEGDVTVRPGDYGLQARFQNIPGVSGIPLDSVSVTTWGVPAAAIHDPWRWDPTGGLSSHFGVPSPSAVVPYLSSPTSCTGEALQASFAVHSYEESEAKPIEDQTPLGPLGGCDRLAFPSTFTAVPTTTSASAPTGLDVELGVHQTNENPEGLATSALQKAVVTLPEGVTVNPSAGAGLAACSQAQYEEEALEVSQERGCPNESKLGTVRIATPALDEEGTGSVYLAQPYANPFSEPEHPDGSLIALYVIARFPNRGVLVKVAGKVTANPLTGQLVTTFEGVPLKNAPSLPGLPPVPFTKFTFSFRQGQTSPLVAPPACGEDYTVQAELTPWSDPAEALTDTSPPFAITSGFGGSACPTGGLPPFSPQVSAGTPNNDAGSYAPLEIRITRNEGEQEITGFSSQLPPGLVANLTGVPFCSEADIALARKQTGAQAEAEPACPAASQIGYTEAGAGAGEVLAYAHGKIYMAGPLEGAPFSIVAITSAKVGPFDLGTVVVHLPLQINPVSAAVTVPAGVADQIPHIIDGIVIHVRDIQVYINRPDFTLNPTSCDRMMLSATVIGSGTSFTNPMDGDAVTVEDPFQAADCASLSFKPTFKVYTSGKTNKLDGASLTAKLTYPSAPLGTQANIAKVKVELPKRLPSRLSTLQKACVETVFYANPAGCPAGSVVGTATAVTPIIPVPLTGPAYFVSHGGAKFPELIIVLQGYGVTLDLHGETFISKQGVTTSTFATVPDAPVGSFELKLLQGPHSALAANGDLCKATLTIPTVFTAQNGAVLRQSTKIDVTGCPKKAKTKAPKRRSSKRGGGRKTAKS